MTDIQFKKLEEDFEFNHLVDFKEHSDADYLYEKIDLYYEICMKLLKEIRIDKKKAEIEQDFVNDDVSEEVVQVEKDFSNTPLPIYKRFSKKLLNMFKKT